MAMTKILRFLGFNSSPMTDNVPQAPDQADRERQARYRRNWDAYQGLGVKSRVNEDGTPLLEVNYLKRNLDKVNYFAFGCGYTMTHPRLDDYLEVTERFWARKKHEKLSRAAQFSSVTGDCFLMIAPTQQALPVLAVDEATKQVLVSVPSTIHTVVINSAYCRPSYHPFDMDELIGMEINVPMSVPISGTGTATQYETRFTRMEITRDTVVTSQCDLEGNEIPGTRKEEPNPIGEVYVRHIRNYALGDSIYGMDDVRDADRLNQELSTSLTSINRVLKYHGDPITCIFGGKATGLTKGANRIWSGFSDKARVENLTLQTDLAAANGFFKDVKQSLHALQGVPEIAQGTEQAISNTSGVALHTMYLPLLERADVKQQQFSPELLELSIIGLKWMAHLGMPMTVPGLEEDAPPKKLPVPTDEQYDDLREYTEIVYGSPLPKDKMIEVQVQSLLVTNKLQSRRAALVALGVSAPDKLLEEIDKDVEASVKAAQDAMVQQAALAVKPAADKQVWSGFEADTGKNTTETEEQRGRPRTTSGE